MSVINVTVQSAGGTRFTTNVSTSMTVVDFKTQISEEANCSPDQQQLIHRGRVLRDEATLESYGIMDGHRVHLVRSSRAQNTADSPQTQYPSFSPMGANPSPLMFGGGMNPAANPFAAMMNMQQGPPDINRMQQQLLQNPEMMQSIMNSPMMQNLMDNPDVIRNMLQNNPQMQAVLQENPQLTHVLNDPSLMRQTMEMIRNPAAMREMMRTQDLAISQLENHPEGFNALRRMYTDVQEPMMEATINAASSDASTRQTGTASTTDNASGALPNPWASTPSQPAPSNPGGGGVQDGAGPMGGLPPGFLAMMGGAPDGALPGATPGGMPDMNTYMQMMQNPFMQQMMSQMFSDPNMMEQMVNSNPMMRQMMDSNPAVGQMLRNPEFLRRLSDPATIQSMIQMEQAMQQMQRGGGENPMAALMQQMQRQHVGSTPRMNPWSAASASPRLRVNPWANAPSTDTPQTPQPTSSEVSNLDFTELLTRMGAATVQEESSADTTMQEESSVDTTMQEESSANVPPTSTTETVAQSTPSPPSATTPTAESVSDSERYATQLQQLEGMGFCDTDANLRALVETRGNVNEAVERLLGAC